MEDKFDFDFDYGDKCHCDNCVNQIGKEEFFKGFNFAIETVKKVFRDAEMNTDIKTLEDLTRWMTLPDPPK